MISFEHALSKLLFLANKIDVEEVNLEEAFSRILANDAISSRDQPPFDASSMDGYALKKIDKLPNKKLLVVGKVAAGKSFKGTIKKGEAVRIFTGAPMPSGANSILIQEDAEELDNFIKIRQKVEKNDFIRKKGCDYKAGKILLKKGKILRSFDIALLASMNLPLLKVTRRPRVSIISTGDELVVPGNLPKNNQIVASNTYGLKALLNKWGATSHILPIARDNKTSLEKALDLAVPADLVITIGGASVGDHDYVSEVFNKIKNNLKPIDRPSNNFQSSIENKDVSQILTTMNTDSQIQILPPISSPQNNQIKDNAPVMAQPSQTPQPSTKELVDTNSPVTVSYTHLTLPTKA